MKLTNDSLLEINNCFRTYFAVPGSAGEQFFVFSNLLSWLLGICGRRFEAPLEVSLSICLFVCLFVCLSVRLSVFLCHDNTKL